MAEHYDTYVAAMEVIRKAKEQDSRRGDLQATADLVRTYGLRTLDGEPIRVGMRVVDYDLRKTTIVGIQSVAYSPDGKHVIWFETANGGMFDAGRLWSKMP